MPDKITMVENPNGAGTLQLYGHVEKRHALRNFRSMFQRMKSDAEEALRALDADEVKVYHQVGVHRVRDRREV